MTNELVQFQQNVDEWIKEMTGELRAVKDVNHLVVENMDNTQHNYELVNELKGELEDLKEEIKLLKTMQTIILKKHLNEIEQAEKV